MRTRAFESRKNFPRNTSRVVAALVLFDFYRSISFIDELLASKLPTCEYRIVQYRLCAIIMQKIDILRWQNFVYVQDSFLLFFAHTDQ